MHRYQCRQTPLLLQLTIDLWKTTTPNKFHIWKNAQIPVQTDPTPILQLTIDLWKTTTLNKFHISKNAQIPVQTDPVPPPIDHRSMEDHYTKQVSHIEECTYTNGRWTPHNRAEISTTPLHFITFTYRRMNKYHNQP